jgi:hypothetical protein
LSQSTLQSVLSAIDNLLDKKARLTETSEDIRIFNQFGSPKEWKQLQSALATFWSASKVEKNLFELNIVMTKAQAQEIVHFYEDCSSDWGEEIFDRPWEDCEDCPRFLSMIGEVSSTSDFGSAPQIFSDFLSHLTGCTSRSVTVQLEIVIKKGTLSKVAYREAGQPKFVDLSIWYDVKNFQTWLTSLSPWDFFHNYAERLNAVHTVLLHHSDKPIPSSSGTLTILSVSSMLLLSDISKTALRESDIDRIRKEADGLAREVVFKDVPLIPPGILIGEKLSSGTDLLLEPLCPILAYSIFSIFCDSAKPSGQFTEFINDLPYGAQSVKVSFSIDSNDLIISCEQKADVTIHKSEWIRKASQLYSTFFEHPGKEGYGALRKTAISELLKLKFSNIVELVLETTSLLAYYANARNALLERRIDELATVMEKISDSAVKSSVSLSDMMESMQHDITNVSILLLGALLAQVYSFISRALNVKQLFLLLAVFGILSSLFLLTMDFRLSDVEDSGRFIKKTFDSLEDSLFHQTGLAIVAWREFVRSSYESLLKRVEIVDTLTWGALASDIIVTYYILNNLVSYGYAWWLPPTSGVGTALVFAALFWTIRKTKTGLEKVKGRSTLGTLLVALTLTALLIGTVLLIVEAWSKIV